MKKNNNIIISSLDADRLEALLDSQGDKHFAGREELLAELDRADIVEPQEIPAKTVTMNSTVKFKEKSTGKEFALTLCYPKDIDQVENSVSILAPVGSALLGLSEGDEIEWPKPGGGMLMVEIIEVMFQPEREGEYHR